MSALEHTSRPRESRDRFPPASGGFTLIELVIVLAVLIVLATLAVNSYRDYVLRSGRSEAMTALTELARLQESYYGNRRTYADSLATLNYSATTDNELYQLQIPASTTTSYTLRATAINAQLQDQDCREFELTSMGERSAEDAGSADTTTECWAR